MYNYAHLIGRLTNDPEITETESGKKVCHITLAVQRSFKNSDGIYEADFIRCTMWDVIATRACEFCHKGDLVAIRGQLRTSSYVNDKEEKRYTIDVIVEKIIFLSTKTNETKELD
jgi:single-strand DNA-binding protein